MRVHPLIRRREIRSSVSWSTVIPFGRTKTWAATNRGQLWPIAASASSRQWPQDRKATSAASLNVLLPGYGWMMLATTKSSGGHEGTDDADLEAPPAGSEHSGGHVPTENFIRPFVA